MTTEQIKAELYDLEKEIKVMIEKANAELKPLAEKQEKLTAELKEAEKK